MIRLPYFDPIRFHVVDVMHAIFLGTTKHVFKTWLEVGVIDDHKLQNIDSAMGELKLPTDVGRIPSSISSWKRMKAQE